MTPILPGIGQAPRWRNEAPTCSSPNCLRPIYAEELCKRHRDEAHYARMRELERKCHKGVRVYVSTMGDEYLEGVALSGVRIVWKPIPSRDRWPSVLVQVDGHQEAVEWPAIDVELA